MDYVILSGQRIIVRVAVDEYRDTEFDEGGMLAEESAAIYAAHFGSLVPRWLGDLLFSDFDRIEVPRRGRRG